MGLEPVVGVIFSIFALIMSVVIHEVAHGAVALSQGDPTAKMAGRLTLNPVNHLDPFGSFLLPLLLYFLSQGSFVFGWAKPVPYNPYNLRNQRWGPALVAAAGPLSNLALAVAAATVFNLLPINLVVGQLLVTVTAINVVLAVFNLLPIPPLDGSKALFSLLPARFEGVERVLSQYGLMVLVVFLVFGGGLISVITYQILKLFLPL